eukprot:358916-Chlamydomonas_euryale.AAC.2
MPHTLRDGQLQRYTRTRIGGRAITERAGRQSGTCPSCTGAAVCVQFRVLGPAAAVGYDSKSWIRVQ